MEEELVADCEAFLLGAYAERLAAAGRFVPVWAWTNLLAHGSEDDLRRERDAASETGLLPRSWRAARSYLAAEILEEHGRSVPLADVQRDVLRPLELQLSRNRHARGWDPPRWVAAVRVALSVQRRPSGPLA